MKKQLRILTLIMILLTSNNLMSKELPIIYLISGQGADHRLFNKLEINPEFEVRHIQYFRPDKNITLKKYAKQLATQIDTTQKIILIGVSLGGMIATEMKEFLNPEKVIIISSAKSRNELPSSYKFQRKIPIYKILSPKMAKRGALIMQPIFEPDRNKEKETFVNMLKDKDPLFLRRTIEMIMTWEREVEPEGIIHIHGDKDKTIPIRNVKCDYKVKKGSHMMTLTRGEEISSLVNEILTKTIIE